MILQVYMEIENVIPVEAVKFCTLSWPPAVYHISALNESILLFLRLLSVQFCSLLLPVLQFYISYSVNVVQFGQQLNCVM